MSACGLGRRPYARYALRSSSGPAPLEAPAWDLSRLYASIDDPNITKDLDKLRRAGEAFHEAFRGRLGHLLGPALHSLIRQKRQLITLHAFADISAIADRSVAGRAKKIEAVVEEIEGEFYGSFESEIAQLDDVTIARLAADDDLVRSYLLWINEIRANGPFFLNPDVEAAILKREKYGAPAWSDGYLEMMVRLRCHIGGRACSVFELEELAHRDADPSVRVNARTTLNGTLRDHMSTFAALALNSIVGVKAVDDKERGYDKPYSSVNAANRISNEIMDRLHDIVLQYGGKLARRFIRLKAKLLGCNVLNWSERFAMVAALPPERFTFPEARALIERAYGQAFPSLLPIVREMFDARRIDAEQRPNKWGGDCTYAFIRPDGTPTAYTQSNFQGTWGSVCTLGHELGHACHEITALDAYGPLMGYTPVAVSEIAAVLCEINVYRARRAEIEASGDRKALLTLLLHRIELAIGHIVDQCVLHAFEDSIHDGQQRNPEEYMALWRAAIKKFYGDERVDFTYADTEWFWTMLDNLRAPFTSQYYVLAHLCAEAVEAQRERLGEGFEPLIVQILRESGVKPVVELMQMLGIDLQNRDFASAWIETAIEGPLDELEKLGLELGLLNRKEP